MPTLLKSILVAATLAVVMASTSATATAATTNATPARTPAAVDQSAELAAQAAAINDREVDLRFPTTAGAPACVSRDIYLGAGEYIWWKVAMLNGPAYDWPEESRYLDLAAGWYHWKDCVGALSQGGHTYYHDTYLRQQSTGGYAHLARTTGGTSSRGTFWTYFGSYLQKS